MVLLDIDITGTTGQFWEEQALTGASLQNCREEMLIKPVSIGVGSSERWEWYSTHSWDNEEGKFGGECWSSECEAFWGRDAGTPKCNSQWGCFWNKSQCCNAGSMQVLLPFHLGRVLLTHKVTRTVLLPMKQVEREDSDLIACSLKNYIPICTSIHGVCLVWSWKMGVTYLCLHYLQKIGKIVSRLSMHPNCTPGKHFKEERGREVMSLCQKRVLFEVYVFKWLHSKLLC